MSTAAKFGYAQAFPICITDQSAAFSASVYDYVGNLTLTQVMNFYWDIEAFYITWAGSATSGGGTTSGVGHYAVNDPSILPRYVDASPWDQGTSDGGGWFPFSGSLAWASWPQIKQPNTRMCFTGSNPSAGIIQGLGADKASDPSAFFGVSFAISTDPSNAGKYRLYYTFRADFPQGTGPALSFANPAANSGAVVASGTLTLGGFTLNWQATTFGTSTSVSGLNMSATSSSFTY